MPRLPMHYIAGLLLAMLAAYTHVSLQRLADTILGNRDNHLGPRT